MPEICKLTFLCLIIATTSAKAAPPANPATAGAFVRQALEREIQGDAASRALFLQRATMADADHAPARWLSGQVLYDEAWRDYREIPLLEAQRDAVREYLKRRQQPTTAAEHLELADWCRANGLPLRERAHLVAALERSNSTGQLKIRSRLGHQLIGGVWMTPEALAENLELAERISRASQIWTPRLKTMLRQLHSPRADVREKAKHELFAIDDPDVLPAMEAVFSGNSFQTADLFVEFLAQLKLVEADRFLARQAVLSPFVTVREQAAKALRSRPAESYMPIIMEGLRTPIQSRMTLFAGQTGIRLTQRLSSETQDVRQIVGLDSQTRFLHANHAVPILRRWFPLFGPRRNNFRIGTAEQKMEAELLRKQLQAYEQKRAVDLKNDELSEQNDRIFSALRTTTGLNLPDDPKAWWAWWDDYNNLLPPGEKPVEYEEYSEVRRRIVPHLIVRRMSCLAKGTPIWTDRGFLPVENVQVGDLVLSRHAKTGELAYKPVLKATVRPRTELVEARFEDSNFLCTKGHTFWISGKGWQKVRDTKPGDWFHAVNSAGDLKALEPAKSARTFNLVVADFHTYFVGKNMLLSHDVTFAAPLNNPVPGWQD